MSTILYPGGPILFDPALVLAQANGKQTALASGVTTAALAAGVITGGSMVTVVSAATTPGTQTTRTAAQMYADDPLAYPGMSYRLRICQGGANTLTLGAGTDVTLVGTMTVATNTYRDFSVVISGTAAAPLYTITSIGLGTHT